MKTSFYIKWFVVLLAFTLGLIISQVETKNTYYDLQVASSHRTLAAYQVIHEARMTRGIAFADPTRANEVMDPLETGLIGYWLTDITTTSGSLDAKRLSVNPNFAAVVIDMIYQAGLRPGDEIGVVMSGSFPAIAIATLCSLEEMGVKTCTIASIGASSYGANIPDFTLFDMLLLLQEENILSLPLDYVAWGGLDDTGSEFPQEVHDSIQMRIDNSGIPLLQGGTLEASLHERMDAFSQKLPRMKMFINIGGHFSSLGEGYATYLEGNGLLLHAKRTYSENRGLIHRYLEQGLPVAHFINIESLVLRYGLTMTPEAPTLRPEQEVYMHRVVNFPLLMLPLLLSVGLFIEVVLKKKNDPLSFMTY
ncbi:MAG: poly-gamma-glutamate system protein [Bacilli bacterium]|nr:poly-gamma-glutamate system protein [Bacilli bacterium]